MKTEQEQIKAIKQIIDERVETTLGQVQGRHDNVIKTVDTVIIARDIVNAGYGDVSEYKAEIERLKAENKQLEEQVEEQRNEKWDAQDDLDCYCDEMPNKVKQAKIDVLNELKKYLHTEDFDTPDERWKPESEFCAIIDKLIKKIENE